MGNENSSANCNDDILQTYQQLISMGFDENVSWSASQKYKHDLNKCIDFINKNMKKKASNIHKIEKQNTPIIYQGYLCKQGYFGSSEKLWVVLKKRYLYLYKEKTMHLTNEIEKIDLLIHNVVKISEGYLQFKFEVGRKTFVAHSKQNMLEWVNNIKYQQILKEDFLYQADKTKKYWVVLKGKYIFYYAKKKVYQKKIEKIDLSVYNKVKISDFVTKPGQFELVSNSLKAENKVLISMSNENMLSWIQEISNVQKQQQILSSVNDKDEDEVTFMDQLAHYLLTKFAWKKNDVKSFDDFLFCNGYDSEALIQDLTGTHVQSNIYKHVDNHNKFNDIKQFVEYVTGGNDQMDNDEHEYKNENYDMIYEETQNYCEQISDCLCVQRIKKLMILYDEYVRKNDDESITNVINKWFESTYTITDIINDYIHITTKHDNLQDIYDQFILNVKCNLTQCTSLKRNQRDRMRNLATTKDNKTTVIIDIIDQIHCYILHTFDTGYKLTRNEENLMYQCSKQSRYDDTINLCFNKMNSILDHKRKTFSSIFGSDNEAICSKFVTTTVSSNSSINLPNMHNDVIEQKHQNKADEIDTGSSGITYNFSHRFYYLDPQYDRFYYLHDFSLNAKYRSLKMELTSNPICSISWTEWKYVTEKAAIYFDTKQSKQLQVKQTIWKTKKRQQSVQYKRKGCGIENDNLLVIIFYTDFDRLSFKFSQTFRKLKENETKGELLKRHQNYYWMARILRETVEYFGINYTEESKEKFFHGISSQMVFNSTIARFNHPTSTTKQIIVAQTFATVEGIIIKIGGYDTIGTQYFDCSWISAFGNEEESLFIGGSGVLKIENIINCSTGKEYKLYLHALNQLIRCVTNEGPYTATKKDTEILDLLLKQKYSSLPKYFVDIYQSYMKCATEINVEFEKFKHCSQSSYFVSLLLSSDDLQQSFINLKNISKLFPNVQKVKIRNGYSYDGLILVSTSYVSTIASGLIQYLPSKLTQIEIINAWINESIINNFKTDFEKLTNFTVNCCADWIYIKKLGY